jgi:hypothetical protein
MKKTKDSWFRIIVSSLVLAALIAGGCTVGEAVVDGFYGGIADTIARLVSETLLDLSGL